MKKIFLFLIFPGAALLSSSCTGRTDSNMTPAGETVEVVIPAGEIAADSIIANGDMEQGIEVL